MSHSTGKPRRYRCRLGSILLKMAAISTVVDRDLRHFQVGYPGSAFTSAEDVHKTGANVINIHQGVDTMINRTHHNGHVVFSSLTADAMSLLLLSIYQLPLHP